MWCVLLFQSLGDRPHLPRPLVFDSAGHCISSGRAGPRSHTARRGAPACIIGGNLVGARLAAVVFVRHGTSWSSPVACHCFAAHPRFGVQAFSLGGLGFEAPNSPDAILEGTNAYTSFYVISWIAIGVGGVLGILAFINEVRTFASHEYTPKYLLWTECVQFFERLYMRHLKTMDVLRRHPTAAPNKSEKNNSYKDESEKPGTHPDDKSGKVKCGELRTSTNRRLREMLR